MKRSMPWSDDEGDSSSDESSASDTNAEPNGGSNKDKAKNSVISSRPSKEKTSEVDAGKKKSKALGFEALRKHGYKGGLSVLRVPLPKEEHNQDWSWSKGNDRPPKETEETYEERQKTRYAIIEGEQLRNVQTQKEKNASFAQKEKRKRDLGQASRGKSYVEEEKRLLRESGVYSGFDT